MNMDFGTSKTSLEVIKKGAFGELILKIFILVLMINGTDNHGKNYEK